MKRILITSGAVYGNLDSNKLVGNRVRGIWANKFAEWLAEHDYKVTLLMPDLMKKGRDDDPFHRNIDPVYHSGYSQYADLCEKLAVTHNAAIMAGAVVNWIPLTPYPGKMPTEGYNEGDVINVPFFLAPRVIDKMKKMNPKLTLIGCKMLVNAEHEELIDAAYHVLLRAKCNVVIANDMGKGLKSKHLVYQDRTVVSYENDFDGFFQALRLVIEDEHWHSEETPGMNEAILNADYSCSTPKVVFDKVVEKYRSKFTSRGDDKVFGSLLVPFGAHGGYLASPREKGPMFSSKDAVWVAGVSWKDRKITVGRGARATLNAPLMVRFAGHVQRQAQKGSCFALGQPVVLHLHEQLPGVITLPYAPPGTNRDNLRDLPNDVTGFNIEGHGFIACLDNNLDLQKDVLVHYRKV